jgi:hypothetical protein
VDVSGAAALAFAAGEGELAAAGVDDDGLLLWGVADVEVGVVVAEAGVAVEGDDVFGEGGLNGEDEGDEEGGCQKI